MIESLFVLCLVMAAIGTVFGVIYPLTVVACCKLYGSKKTIREILEEF